MPDKLLFELEGVAHMTVQLDLGIAGHGEEGPVRTERVVCNRLVEEEMNFGGYHGYYISRTEDDRSSTRLSTRCGDGGDDDSDDDGMVKEVGSFGVTVGVARSWLWALLELD